MSPTRKLKRLKKRFVTLIEMMIVMFLIALISGVVAFNYQASLEKGKAFKTEQQMEKIRTILALRLAEDDSAFDNMESEWPRYIRESPLVKNPDDLLKDGWGKAYQIQVIEEGESGFPEIEVTSDGYKRYKKK